MVENYFFVYLFIAVSAVEYTPSPRRLLLTLLRSSEQSHLLSQPERHSAADTAILLSQKSRQPVTSAPEESP